MTKFDHVVRYVAAVLGGISVITAVAFVFVGEYRDALSEASDAALYSLLWLYIGWAIKSYSRGRDDGYRDAQADSRWQRRQSRNP